MMKAFLFCLFFFNDTATTEIYTLSLHDALPICPQNGLPECAARRCVPGARRPVPPAADRESAGERDSLSPPWTATRPAMHLPAESPESRSDSTTGHAEGSSSSSVSSGIAVSSKSGRYSAVKRGDRGDSRRISPSCSCASACSDSHPDRGRARAASIHSTADQEKAR